MTDTTQNGPDVRRLAGEKLAEAPFPGAGKADFRIWFAPDAHAAVWEHAKADTSVEICGVLVGRWGRDTDGPYVTISHVIRGEAAESKQARVKFTHAAWEKINREKDTKYDDEKIVGWYHTHPDFGIFFSEDDRFSHSFFGSDGQIAYVVDPVREQEGVFVWREGKPVPAPHHWVGSDIRTPPPEGDRRLRFAASADREEGASGSSAGPAEPAEPAWMMVGTRLCLGLLLFLAGYQLANWMGAEARRAEDANRVAERAFYLGVRPYLAEEAQRLSDELRDVEAKVVDQAEKQIRAAGEDAEAAKGPWREILGLLGSARSRVVEVQRYGLTPAEQARLVALYEWYARQREAAKAEAAGKAQTSKTDGSKPPDGKPEASKAVDAKAADPKSDGKAESKKPEATKAEAPK